MNTQDMYDKIKNYSRYKNKTKEELWELAEKKAAAYSKDVDIVSKFKNTIEKKVASDLLRKYLHDYTIENVSDKNTLKEIIYLEVIHIRLQEKLNTLYEKDKAVPTSFIELIHKNSDAIIKLKNTLGLTRDKNSKRTAYDVLAHMKKRYAKWLEENQGSRTLVCPHCGKMVLLKILMDAWEAQRHPFFRDKVLYNEHLFNNLNKTVNIDRDFIAKVLETSPDYVNWIESKQPNKEVKLNGSSNS